MTDGSRVTEDESDGRIRHRPRRDSQSVSNPSTPSSTNGSGSGRNRSIRKRTAAMTASCREGSRDSAPSNRITDGMPTSYDARGRRSDSPLASSESETLARRCLNETAQKAARKDLELRWFSARSTRRALTARGESPAAFDERCILAICVAPPSNTGGIFTRRALFARRLTRLGAAPNFHDGLLRGPKGATCQGPE